MRHRCSILSLASLATFTTLATVTSAAHAALSFGPPRPSGFVALSNGPCAPTPDGSAFQTLQVTDDLHGVAGFPSNPLLVDDVQMRFLAGSLPSNPIAPPGPCMMAVSDEATFPNGFSAGPTPGAAGFFTISSPATDSAVPNGPCHVSLSALLLNEAAGSSGELAYSPAYPGGPIFTLLAGGTELKVETWQTIPPSGANPPTGLVQHTVFDIALNVIPSDSCLIANVSVARGSVDMGFDLDFSGSAVIPANTPLLTLTTTADVEVIPEPASLLLLLAGVSLVTKRKRHSA